MIFIGRVGHLILNFRRIAKIMYQQTVISNKVCMKIFYFKVINGYRSDKSIKINEINSLLNYLCTVEDRFISSPLARFEQVGNFDLEHSNEKTLNALIVFLCLHAYF